MKKIQKSIRNLSVVVFITWLCVAFVATAGATLSLVKPDNSGPAPFSSSHQIISNSGEKSHAPEPSTMALFGSGFIGIIISLVRKAYEKVKRLFDLATAAVALLVLSPLCLFIAFLIKLTSRGPILFKQERVGKDEIPFEMYKFRTMRVDAEKETGPVWAGQNDHRLIPIGKFMRKAHVDEIPQFINVLRGEMSVIGPRPERPFFVEKLSQEIPDYKKRLAVKPGITGLAQVRHKYDETIKDVRKKVRYDLLYIRKSCFGTDLGIILRTFKVVLTGEGAH